MNVTPETERSLREAMQRLLEGRPQCTDGARTVANLAREANVSRATANRAAAVLAEFRSACDGGDLIPRGQADNEARVSALKKRVRELTADVTRIQEEKEALALASLVLFEENRRLAKQLNAPAGSNMRVLGRPPPPNSEDHAGADR